MKRFFAIALCLGPIWCYGQAAAPAKIQVPSQLETPTPNQTAFNQADPKVRLNALRAFHAQKKGKSEISPCPGVSNVLPTTTSQDIQAYYQTFGANFDLAASFGDTGAGGIPSAQNSIQSEVLGQIQFESEHFFYDYTSCLSHRPSVSFGGTVGLQPALVLENLSSTTATITNPNDRPMFQDSFGWTLGPKVNIATSHLSQLAFFTTLGQKYLISQVSSFKQGDDTVTATPVSNNVGQSAMFWESGVEWKYLNTDIVNAYTNKTDILSPPFTISAGYKRDGRFNKAGDLSGFSDPEARVFFRFSVGLNKIGNWSGDQVDPGKGYTFKFGIDHERPIGDGRLPKATRYYVSANIDLLKVFKPSEQK